MGVDWIACHRCEETFPDCGSYVYCEPCGTHWCSDYCATEDGYKREKWEDEDGYEYDSSCKYCRQEDFTDTQLLEYVMKNATVSREKLVEYCKSNYEIAIISVEEHKRLMSDSDRLSDLEF